MKKALKIIGNTLLYAFIGIALFIFVSAIASIVQGNIPSVFGYNVFIVETGSMEPTIEVGEVIFSKKSTIDEVKQDDVITFICIDTSQPIAGQVITHRAIKVETIDGVITITTKGDNNLVEDTYKVTASNFMGIVKGQSKFVGKFITLVTNGMIVIVPLAVLVICGMFGFKILMTYKKESQEEEEKERLEDLKKELLKEIIEENNNGKEK